MFIVIFSGDTAPIVRKTKAELVDGLLNSDEPVEFIFELGDDIREDICTLAFQRWWDSWVSRMGNRANDATSGDAPDFLGEMMGAIWLERRISDKCEESGK